MFLFKFIAKLIFQFQVHFFHSIKTSFITVNTLKNPLGIDLKPLFPQSHTLPFSRSTSEMNLTLSILVSSCQYMYKKENKCRFIKKMFQIQIFSVTFLWPSSHVFQYWKLNPAKTIERDISCKSHVWFLNQGLITLKCDCLLNFKEFNLKDQKVTPKMSTKFLFISSN